MIRLFPGLPRPLAVCAALSAGMAMAGCTISEPAAPAIPAFYQPLTAPGARIDNEAARATISAYRLNNGLKPLANDASLQALAQAEAQAMARADRPGAAEAVKAKASAAGFGGEGLSANVSAGYHTFAEAFSGWRESPAHDRTMRAASATRMGIATAFAPGSKYQVYWVLVVAP